MLEQSVQENAAPPRVAGKTVGMIAAAGFLGAVALTAGVRLASAANRMPDAQHVAPGVRVAEVSVGGLSRDEAREKVRRWASARSQKPITLAAPISGRRWNIALADAGGRFDVDGAVTTALAVGKNDSLWERFLHGDAIKDVTITPTFRLNEKLLDRRLAEIGKAIRKPARNARVKVNDAGQVVLAAGEQKGIRLDAAATKAALLKGGPEALRNGGQAALVIAEEQPKVTAADIGKMGSLLASFTTDYSSSIPPRRHNVELAASLVNGTMVAPGEVFSYNDVVGPREARYGWREALMYEDGEVVPGMGGGVCQVSSTLYNVVLRANLKVVARSNHSIPVHYVGPGRDATVVYGALDFKFRNTTDGPLLILARTRNRELTFNLYGKEPTERPKVELVSSPRREIADGGYRVTTYRVVTDTGGRATREYLSTDTYRPPKPKSSDSDRPRRPVRRRAPRPAPTAPAPRPQPVQGNPA